MRTFVYCMLLAAVTAVSQAKVVTKTVEYRQGETVMRGYLAYDDSSHELRPGVLVVHEWWGLNDYAKERARQLAELGYVALAADMYGGGIVATTAQEAGKLAGAVRGKPVLRERAQAALDELKKSPLVDADRIAAIGFCFGGTAALELAYAGAPLAGVVTFHGGLTTPKPEDHGRIKAKMLVLHGAADPLVPPAQVAAWKKSMDQEHVDWQLIKYSGAVHAFSNPAAGNDSSRGVAYQERAARRSWDHMQLFFKEIFGTRPH